jgi:lipoyl-dependent peroxiredoxin
MPTRTASAAWTGTLKAGQGSYTGESGTLAGSYSAGTRFGEEPGSNPEELLAAAHAACFSMALSLGLEKHGTPPERIHTTARCTVERVGEGFTITTMQLDCRATVAGIEQQAFADIARATKDACPVSRALAGVKIELQASLG